MATAQHLVVLITALPVERAAVLEHLRDVAEEPERAARSTAAASSMKNPNLGTSSSPRSAPAIRGLPPRRSESSLTTAPTGVLLFVGVAGAIKDLKHGDVVASTKVYGYESGKDQHDGFGPRPFVQLPAYELEQRARYEAGEPDWRLRIKAPGSAGPELASVAKVGPIAAGEKVLASNRSQIYKLVRENYGDALAVEMEGHGFLLGVHMNHPTPGIVIRSISDCISDKNEASDENWQPVAARHAAAFAFQILAKLTNEEGGATHQPSDGATLLQVRRGTPSFAPTRLTIPEKSAAEILDNLKGVTLSYEFLERVKDLYLGRWTREPGWQAKVYILPSKLSGGRWSCIFRRLVPTL